MHRINIANAAATIRLDAQVPEITYSGRLDLNTTIALEMRVRKLLKGAPVSLVRLYDALLAYEQRVWVPDGAVGALLVSEDQYETVSEMCAQAALCGITRLAFPPNLHRVGIAWARRHLALPGRAE